MATRRSDKTRADLLPEERAVSRAYDGASREAPPAPLDQAILGKAREALAAPSGRASFGKRWAVPLSVAAVVVLSVSVVLRLSEQSALEPSTSSPPIAQTPPVAADRFAGERPAKRRAQTETYATAPATPRAMEEIAPAAQAMRERVLTRVEPTSETERRGDGASPPTARTGSVDAKLSEKPSTYAVAPASELREKAAERAPERLLAKSSAVKHENKLVGDRADVVSIRINGNPRAYEFVVGIRSPDTGCAKYADWWEVVGVDGRLWHRQVLAHSHVSEQPFVRAGGPVPLSPRTVVWVRAHMNTTGYGGVAFKGSAEAGFIAADPPAAFAVDLARQGPLPKGCDF